MHDYPPTYSSPRDVDLRRQACKPLFGLGRLVATPGALNILTTAQCHPVQLLQRHQHVTGAIPANSALRTRPPMTTPC